jgi:hypothetical protein
LVVLPQLPILYPVNSSMLVVLPWWFGVSRETICRQKYPSFSLIWNFVSDSIENIIFDSRTDFKSFGHFVVRERPSTRDEAFTLHLPVWCSQSKSSYVDSTSASWKVLLSQRAWFLNAPARQRGTKTKTLLASMRHS